MEDINTVKVEILLNVTGVYYRFYLILLKSCQRVQRVQTRTRREKGRRTTKAKTRKRRKNHLLVVHLCVHTNSVCGHGHD